MATITVSEETAARLHSAAEWQGKDPATLLIELLNQQEEAAIPAQPLTSEEIAAVERALVEGEAGLGIPFAEYVAERKAAREVRELARA